jgi:hypothetical protein
MMTSEGQSISVLKEILGEKKQARKWYKKYNFGSVRFYD